MPRAHPASAVGAIFACALVALALAVPAPLFAAAPNWPERPVRIIDANAPGGGTDYLARVIGSHLTQRHGQPVVIDNRPGAGGNIGAQIAAKANPDGYTLFMALTPAVAASPALYSQLGYDALRDFAYVTLVASGTFVIVVTRAAPVKTISDLVALARSTPGKLSYSSAGVASPLHLAGELLKRRIGVDMVHVPYKGGAPAIAAVTAGEVQVGFGSVAAAAPLIQAGRLTLLAVTSATRALAYPEVPTVAESGYPGYDVTPTYGILGPAAMPAALVSLLHREIGSILQTADVRTRFATQALEPNPSTSARYEEVMRQEIAQWAKVIKDANIRTE